ncbi:hypothetical protein FRC10_006201 [Ceratobasidium sp. 414]|nr:hypothetical protein FRC10_006201 [Ceratobasidium sp. 414]
MNTPTSLAQITVQVDALSVVKEIEDAVIEAEDIWVSCYETGKPSVHGKVRVAIDEEARDRCVFSGRDGVECQQIAKNTFHISCLSLHISTRTVRFPSRTVRLPPPPTSRTSSKLDYGITSLDISPDGQVWVAGLGDGSVVLGKQAEMPIAAVHRASVSSVKLLADPGLGANEWKVLSASDDFSVSLSSFTTSPPSTSAVLRLKSHTRAVTSLSLLPSSDSQAISGGKDGTLRIWDISPGTGKQLGMLRSSGDVAIMAISVSVSGVLAAMALQSGHFDLVDLDTRSTIFSSSSSPSTTKTYGALDAIALYTLSEPDGRHILVTGSRSGVLSFYICAVKGGGVDVRSVGSCVRNGAGVSDIKLVASSKSSDYPTALVATTDGLPYQLQLTPTPGSESLEFEVVAEYAGGADCSPIQSIIGCVKSREVWMAGDDGAVWVYEL